MDTIKKRDLGSGIRNVANLFKRKEKPVSEQPNALIGENSLQGDVDQQNVALDSGAIAIEPGSGPEEKIPEASRIDVTPAIVPETSVEETREKEESSIAATTDLAMVEATLPAKVDGDKESLEQDKSRPRKSNVMLLTTPRVKEKVEKKEKDIPAKHRETREEKKRIVATETRGTEKATKATLDASTLAEIKVKMRKMLAVATRVRIDMLKDYLELENGQFLQFLVDEASEFGYKIDGDYIVLDTVVVSKFTVT